ncbi:Transcriptional regulatory protein DegU [Streptomyces sp. enrichment culture]|uniref:LuxR C-terminal-related transcriptional regulator n=1 Tax=Streptomyces sp. enrichment culture TaxID=1795815 RepID=UPI003F554B97
MEINLFIISDDPITLAGLEAIVDQNEKFLVIGRSIGGAGIRCPQDPEPRPHVIIIGEPSSKRTLCENARRIAALYPCEKSRPKIIVVSQNDDDDTIVAALRAGVNGYLSRIESPEELLHSIQLVAKGGAAFSPTVASRLSRYFSATHVLPELAAFSELTDREMEILELLASGMGNQQIARRLFLAEKTVRNYVSRFFTKLEVHDRAMAAVVARDAGLGGQPDVLVPQGIGAEGAAP